MPIEKAHKSEWEKHIELKNERESKKKIYAANQMNNAHLIGPNRRQS